MQNAIAYVASTATVYLFVVTIAGALGAYGWLFDLHAHFRLQYLVLATVLWWVLVAVRRPVLGVLAATVAAVNLCVLLPLYLAPHETPRRDVRPLTIVSYNVEAGTKDPPYETVARYLSSGGADLVFILEATTPWVEAMQTYAPNYPVAKAYPIDSTTSGMALFSRVPLRAVRLRADLGVPAPSIEAHLTHGGQNYRVLGIHTLPPIKPIYAESRNEAIAAIADWANEDLRRTIIIGDFNATPWSASFGPLWEVGLRNTQRGFGYGGSWPHRPWWLGPLAVPIDHALVSDDLAATRRTLGPAFASDHRALWLTVVPVE